MIIKSSFVLAACVLAAASLCQVGGRRQHATRKLSRVTKSVHANAPRNVTPSTKVVATNLDDDPVEIQSYSLVFLNQQPPEPDKGPSSATNAKDTASDVASLLNDFFKKDEKDPDFAKSQGSAIVLHGHNSQIARAKWILATMIDVPQPQIRTQVWGIQLNELKSRSAIALKCMEVIRKGIAAAKAIALGLTQDLLNHVASKPIATDDRTPWTREQMDLLNSYPFVKLKILSRSSVPPRLLVIDHDTLDALENIIGRRDQMSNLMTAMSFLDDPDLKQLKVEYDNAFRSAKFNRLRVEINKRPATEDVKYLINLARNWRTQGKDSAVSAEMLRNQAFNTDKMLSTAASAYDDDLSDIILKPLTEWANGIVGINSSGRNGFDSSTSSSIAVTSGQPATLAATMSETRSYTAYPSLTSDQIKNLLSLAGKTGPAGSAILDLIATAPTTTNETLAPGISVGLVPTVLPDGSEARVNLVVKSSVSGNDPMDSKAVDAVNSLDVGSDVRVAAYDLFLLSTLQSENTSLGDVSWRIPVLEQLPIFGQMFRGPRRRDTKVHKADVIVSVGILPNVYNMLQTSMPPEVRDSNQKPGKSVKKG